MRARQNLRSIARAAAFGLAISAVIGCASMAHAAGEEASVLAKPKGGRDSIREFVDGVTALQAGRFDEAAAKLAMASVDSPGNTDVWRFLGAARAGLKDWVGSRTAYETALKLDPNDIAVRAGLGVALAALKDPKAQAQMDWITARTKSCGGHCPEADKLDLVSSQLKSAFAGHPTAVL